MSTANDPCQPLRDALSLAEQNIATLETARAITNQEFATAIDRARAVRDIVAAALVECENEQGGNPQQPMDEQPTAGVDSGLDNQYMGEPNSVPHPYKEPPQ